MNIKVKLVGIHGIIPVQRPGDVGADVHSTIRAVVAPGATERIPLGFALEIPEGFAGYILPRSGLSAKGLVVRSPPIDPTYRGEIQAIVYNSSLMDWRINLGDRVAQLVILPAISFCLDQVVELSETERGDKGFGSSGIGPRT